MGSCGSVKYAKEEKKTIQMIDHFQNNALSGFTAVMGKGNLLAANSRTSFGFSVRIVLKRHMLVQLKLFYIMNRYKAHVLTQEMQK